MAHAFRAKTEAPAKAHPTTDTTGLLLVEYSKFCNSGAASTYGKVNWSDFLSHVYSSMHAIFAIFLHCRQNMPALVRQQLQHRQMTLPGSLDVRQHVPIHQKKHVVHGYFWGLATRLTQCFAPKPFPVLAGCNLGVVLFFSSPGSRVKIPFGLVLSWTSQNKEQSRLILWE